jgi:hypothetical protein
MAFSAIAAVSLISAGTSAYGARQQAKAQEQAQNQATKQAKSQEFAADQAFNAANKKKPDIAGITAKAQQDAQGGVGSTMLTGPQGVDASTLKLGKSTLLGG